MPDLRRLGDELVGRSVIPTPDIAVVQARAGRYRHRRATQASAVAVALTLVVGLVGVSVLDGNPSASRVEAGDGGDLVDPSTITLPTVPGGLPGASTTTTAGPTTTTTASGGSTTTTAQPGSVPAPPPDPCPGGRNAGATDVGVTSQRVKVAALGGSRPYVQGYFDRVNKEGGVCGRRIEVVTSGEAFAAIPDAAASGASTTSTPVVGGDGAVKADYASPWAWQVGTTTAAQARIMVKDGWDRGARTFAVVYDSESAFGTEANAAFVAHVQQLGGTLVRSQAVKRGKVSYADEIEAWNTACGNDACDAVTKLLDAPTALAWMVRNPARGAVVTSASHLLMKTDFAARCGSACADFRVWTPYNPPVGERNADVEQYVRDVRAYSPSTDEVDAQGQRAYVGARLLVDGLRQVGANLTRDRLRSALDSLTFATGLAPTLRWSETRYANVSARPLEFVVAQGTFVGFRTAGDFHRDPAP